KNKEAFANEVLSKYPELATNDSFLNELTDKTTNEAYKVLGKWTKKTAEHKEVTHDETDKVAMEPNDFQFVGSYRNKIMHCFEESEKEELTSKLEEILRKYGLLGLQGQLLFDDTVLDKRAYAKE
ncbi:hypothetical protein VD172_002326, partial [Enterococcus faecium]|nr:hypothetical protein [Enterococcus faecium]